METLTIVICIIAYIIIFIGSAMLLTYLDTKYWNAFEDNGSIILLSLIWPLVWSIILIGYLVYIPGNLFSNFLDWMSDTIKKSNKGDKE